MYTLKVNGFGILSKYDKSDTIKIIIVEHYSKEYEKWFKLYT